MEISEPKSRVLIVTPQNDYWPRNRAETTMSRYVTTFTDKLASRTAQAHKNEITLKSHILNTFMAVNSDLLDSTA